MEEVIQYVPNLYATFWALIPPLVAIILALITKEVYSSLFVGIVIGGLFYGNIFHRTVLLLQFLQKVNCNRRTVLWKYIPERVQF